MNDADINNLIAAIEKVADAITPANALPGKDCFDGHVASLTEAVMGISQGLQAIAKAIDRYSDLYGQSL